MNVSPHVAQAARYRRNLRRLYARATDADKREGLAWYPTAQAACLTWADAFNVEARTIACVIAAISPQCDWTSNLRIAFEVLSGQTLVTGGALRANVAKARRILADRALVTTGYFKSGPKVEAFALNLAGHGWAVTIDNHAIQAARNDPARTMAVRATAYSIFADCYHDVAVGFGLRPCDFQAIIWCIWKRRYPAGRKRALIQKRKEQQYGETV
jgi:hypothetical protein